MPAPITDIEPANPPNSGGRDLSTADASDGKSKPAFRLALVDGSGYIFRAFHALPPMTRPDGTPVNAVFGYCNMLMKLIEDHAADRLAVIFDYSGKSFRNEIYAEYKAHRPPPPEELVPQFGLVRDATRAFGVPCVELEGYEADDLIASYAREATAAGGEVVIISSDKDLMQLVGPGVTMQDPIKNRRIGPDEVAEKFGVAPEKVVDVQALAGDSTDNVPGVPGIGVKTAAQLINEYGDLETLLERAGEIKQPKRRESLIEHAEKARISRKLVLLDTEAPLPEPLEAFDIEEPDTSSLKAFLEEQNFRKIIARLDSQEAAPPGTQAETTEPGEAKYELVQDAAALQRWIDAARRAGAFAVDTETTGLDAMRADLVGVSMAVETGSACYIPLGHRRPDATLALGGEGGEAGGELKQIPLEEAILALKPLLEDPAVLKIGHNLKYDRLVLDRYGIDLAPIDDTLLISYVLEGGLHGHGMDELSELHLGHRTIKYSDVAGSGRNQVTFAEVPLDRALDYAAEDADITLRLHRLLKPRLVTERMTTVYERIERPLPGVVTAMEREGVKVDAVRLKELSQDFERRMADLEARAHEEAGRQFNIGSPKQLGEILFDELGLKGGKKGKTGAYATPAEKLEELAAEGHALPRTVLDWRQLAKLKSTYTDALIAAINPDTGRVHTSFHLSAASTGRLATTDPNLQNIPVRTEEGRKIREAFIPEAGNLLLSVDYSQIELRLVAEIGDIGALKEAFRAGEDIHAITASEVFGIPRDQMDPLTRRKAKAINFGIIYGISAFGLARQLEIERSAAAEYIATYFERYPGIKDYMDRMKKAAAEKGYVETLFGRRCHIPGINDRNPARRQFGERQAINAPIQGSAADIIKRAMIRLPAALDESGLGIRMLLQVHDELLFEVPEQKAEEAAVLIRKVMEEAPLPARQLGVPIVAEAGSGRSWAEAH